jgi:hypothetical protein
MSVSAIILDAPPAVRPSKMERYIRTSFEGFSISASTRLLPPLRATSLNEALAETTSRWVFDRGDRLAIREIGEETDRLHVYAVRRKSGSVEVWTGHVPSKAHERWLDHVCTLDLNVVAGIAVGAIGSEVELHERSQAGRPDGARLRRETAEQALFGKDGVA